MAVKREKTRYAGVFFIRTFNREGRETDKRYYIRYRVRGEGRSAPLVEEPVGSASSGMTPLKASMERAARICGERPGNAERRERARQEKAKGPGPFTLWRAWEEFCQYKAGKASLERSDARYIRFLEPLYNRELAGLTTRDVDALSRKLAATPSRRNPGEKLAPASVKHALSLLKAIVRFADREGLCPYPAGLRFTMPKVDNKKTEFMAVEQKEAYWRALNEEADQDTASILRIALLTGMRRGALFGLKWEHLDFENNHILLAGETAKNGKSAYIPMPEKAREVFQAIRRGKSVYVWPGRDGGKRKTVKSMHTRVRDKAGLPPDFRPFHGLRHTYATSLASSGKVSLPVLQRLMTHGTPQVTLRYAHLVDDALQQAAGVADALLAPARKEEDAGKE